MVKYFQQLFALFSIVCAVHGQTNGDLQLLDLDGQTGGIIGRLEVYLNGQWGTVCTTGFDGRDALVACRQLGFANYIFEGTTQGGLLVMSSDVPIWLFALDCTGSESRLLDCPQHAGNFSSCDHSTDVGLICAVNGLIRLVNPLSSRSLPLSGRLEILNNGVWGTVCTDRFSDTDARVACSQMGYSGFARYGSVGDLGFSQASPSTPTWLDEVSCSGAETLFILCPANPFGFEDCDHSQDVGLVCTDTPTTTITTTIATTTRRITTTTTTSADSANVAVIGGGVAGGVVLIIVVLVALILICVCIAKRRSSTNTSGQITVTANIPTETVGIPAGTYNTLNQKSAYYPNESHFPMEQAAHQNVYAGQHQPYSAEGYAAPPSYPPQQQFYPMGEQASYAPDPGDPTMSGYPDMGAPPTFTTAPPPAYPEYYN